MKLVILILILTIFSTQAQTQLRGKNKFEQNDELIEMNNQYTPELQEYSLFVQLTKPLYETAPMDVMLLNHEMEIARMMVLLGDQCLRTSFDISYFIQNQYRKTILFSNYIKVSLQSYLFFLYKEQNDWRDKQSIFYLIY
ncbi:unnamed protein product [Paramecium pentaurelia]|uniref:Uncharacterized protein n=1 Tax=Paramecium pentaurelia TaxID=43138 RepID=A0A8S1RZE4_9CILI|nr:unnamed protein product [Paramecium pentaurelia]